MVGGEGDYIPIAAQQHCHHQKGFCIKLGSNESRFNVPLIVRDKATRQCAQTTTFKEKGEPKRIRPSAYLPNALSLSQTGSRIYIPSSFAKCPRMLVDILGTS